MSTFDFSTLYTNIPHDKLLYVLNEITDFQVISIHTGSDSASLFANLFLFFCEPRCLKSMKNSNYEVARKFGKIFRFIDDLIAINDGKELENH